MSSLGGKSSGLQLSDCYIICMVIQSVTHGHTAVRNELSHAVLHFD